MSPQRKKNLLDYALSKANPWKLSEGQCSVMRMKCQLGMSKIVAAERNVNVKTVERHIEMIRAKMGYPGSDIRVYLAWAEWYREAKEALLAEVEPPPGLK